MNGAELQGISVLDEDGNIFVCFSNNHDDECHYEECALRDDTTRMREQGEDT